jgi:hypothetical protein
MCRRPPDLATPSGFLLPIVTGSRAAAAGSVLPQAAAVFKAAIGSQAAEANPKLPPPDYLLPAPIAPPFEFLSPLPSPYTGFQGEEMP